MDAGVVGLARAFRLAGVKQVVMSLWNVADEPSAFLMTRFMKNLQDDQDSLTAMRAAILSTKERYGLGIGII